MQTELSRAHLLFGILIVGSVVTFWAPLKDLMRFSLTQADGSHILLVAPFSALMLFVKRQEVFSQPSRNSVAALALLLAYVIVGWGMDNLSGVSSWYLSSDVFALILIWISAFGICYGRKALWAARFPLLFLLLMIPIPSFVQDKLVLSLQTGSEAVAYWLFSALGVPVFERGFVLRLPRLEIEVAQECSGIRSSVALLITTLVAGEFLLQSFWKKSLLLLSAIPILILKNGVRIVTISLLTIYIDPAFLHGSLHTSGGIVFYLLALLALFPILVVLRSAEARESTSKEKTPASLQIDDFATQPQAREYPSKA